MACISTLLTFCTYCVVLSLGAVMRSLGQFPDEEEIGTSKVQLKKSAQTLGVKAQQILILALKMRTKDHNEMVRALI